jgi:hypothetical protein
VVFAADELLQEFFVGEIKSLVKPERFEKMEGITLFFGPLLERVDGILIASETGRTLAVSIPVIPARVVGSDSAEFSLGPVAGAVVRRLEMLEEFFNSVSGM